MQTLKELVNKIYTELPTTERLKEYPDLADKWVLADILENIALDIMPDFVQRWQLKDFVEASEKDYTETTFKKFIPNYEKFLNEVENQFYQSLLIGLTE